MALTVALDSAFLVLTVRGKSFTLDAPEASATIGGNSGSGSGGTTTQRRRIHWKYHETYDQAFDLGPVSSATIVIKEIGDLLPPVQNEATDGLFAKWEVVKRTLNQIPVLSNAATNTLETIESTSVKITDLGLELDLTTVTTGGNSTTTGGGAFTIGLAFTPSPDRPVRLFALGLTAFGAVLSVKLDRLKLSTATPPDTSGRLEFE